MWSRLWYLILNICIIALWMLKCMVRYPFIHSIALTTIYALETNKRENASLIRLDRHRKPSPCSMKIMNHNEQGTGPFTLFCVKYSLSCRQFYSNSKQYFFRHKKLTFSSFPVPVFNDLRSTKFQSTNWSLNSPTTIQLSSALGGIIYDNLQH